MWNFQTYHFILFVLALYSLLCENMVLKHFASLEMWTWFLYTRKGAQAHVNFSCFCFHTLIFELQAGIWEDKTIMLLTNVFE